MYTSKNYIDLDILKTIMKKYENTFYIYKFNQNKNIVNINRKKPSLCYICNTIHDSENAYLLFDVNKVYFGCYRNNNKTKIIYNYNEKINYQIHPIENNIDNQIFNKLLLTTLEMRKKIKEYKKQEEETQEYISSWGFDSIKKLNSFIKKYKHHNCLSKKEINGSINNNKFSQKVNKLNNVNGNKERTNNSISRYYELGKNILSEKDTLYNLVKEFGNEKNIYKVKTKALRVVKYFDALKNNNMNNMSITLKTLFNFKKIEFDIFIKNIPLNII